MAAPIRNEWLAKVAGSAPVKRRRVRSCAVRVRKEPSSNWKRGECCGWVVEWFKYFVNSETGQVEVRVDPTVTVQLLQMRSVLDALMSSWAKDGVRERSIRRSERERSNEWADGVQNSLARRKPYNTVEKAAQSMRLSCKEGIGVVYCPLKVPKEVDCDGQTGPDRCQLGSLDALDDVLQ